jgi:hypothetical protein
MKGGTSLRREGESHALAAEAAAGFKGCALFIFIIGFLHYWFSRRPRPFAAVFLALFRVAAPFIAS